MSGVELNSRQAFLLSDRGSKIFFTLLGTITFIVVVGNLLIPEDSLLHVSTYTVTLLGKYLCYALLAMSVDVIWGYCGILSLGHGAFVAALLKSRANETVP